MEFGLKGISAEELRQMKEDIALIKEILFFNKNVLDPEGELSDWAKNKLEEARKRPHSEYASLEEVKKRIIGKR